MGNLYLLRHGKVNGPAALYGKTDIDVLPAINNEMLTSLLDNQARFSRILSSPLIRCQGLAQDFAKQTNKPITIIDALQEMHFGSYDGRAFDDIPYENTAKQSQAWAHLERFWKNPAEFSLPESEKLSDFYYRVKNAWQQLLTNYKDDNILLITHGGVIRMILADILGLDWKNEKLFNQLHIGNASISKFSNTPNNKDNFVKVHVIGMPLSCLTAQLTSNNQFLSVANSHDQ